MVSSSKIDFEMFIFVDIIIEVNGCIIWVGNMSVDVQVCIFKEEMYIVDWVMVVQGIFIMVVVDENKELIFVVFFKVDQLFFFN